MPPSVVSAAILACCRHCARPRSLRRRGLCYGCYMEPGVRERYPAVSVMANRGNGIAAAKVKDAAEIDLALWPCLYPYGNERRIAVMALRAKYKMPLTHPGDLKRNTEAVDDDDNNLFS